MANWCFNNVVFSGDASSVENVSALFREIREKQDRDEKVWLPPFVTAERSYMIDIEVADEKVYYRSRWVPNIDALVQIANQYNVSFVNGYDELDTYLFGEASYNNKLLSNTRLDKGDLRSYHYDLEKGMYIHDGQGYDDEWPIYEKLLEQKKAGELNFKTTSDITKEELTKLYDGLSPGDLVLKFAQHKNFDKARETFREIDEETIIQIDKLLINTHRNTPERYESHDWFLAVSFLKHLIDEWNAQGRDNQYQTSQGLCSKFNF